MASTTKPDHAMEDRVRRNKSVPTKYVTINDLRDQWLKKQQQPGVEEPPENEVEKEEEFPKKYVTILDLKQRWLKQQHEEQELYQTKTTGVEKGKGHVEFNGNSEEGGKLEKNNAQFRRNVGKCGSYVNPNLTGEMGRGEDGERESLVNPNLGEGWERGREFRRNPKNRESSVNPNLIGEWGMGFGRNPNWKNGRKPFRNSENMATRNRVVKEDNSAIEVSGISEGVEIEPKIDGQGQLKGDGIDVISKNMRKKLWKERKRSRKASGETQKRNSGRDNSTNEMSEMKDEVGIEADIHVSGELQDERKTVSNNGRKKLWTGRTRNRPSDGETRTPNLAKGKRIAEEEDEKMSEVPELNNVGETDVEIDGRAHLKNDWVSDGEWKMTSNSMRQNLLRERKQKLLKERRQKLLNNGETDKRVLETGKRMMENEGEKMSDDGVDNLNAEMNQITGLVNQIMVTENHNVSENGKIGKKKMKKAGRNRDGTPENEARVREVTVSGKQFPKFRTRYMLKKQNAVQVLEEKGIPVTENRNECGEEEGSVKRVWGKMSEDRVDNSTAEINQSTGLVQQIVVTEKGSVSENGIRNGVIDPIVEVTNVSEVTVSRKWFPEIKTCSVVKKLDAVPVSEDKMREEGIVLEKSIPATEDMVREVSGKRFTGIKTREMLEKLNAVPVLEGKTTEQGVVLEKNIHVAENEAKAWEMTVSGKEFREIKVREMPEKLNAVLVLKNAIREDGTVLEKSTTHVTHNSGRGEEGASVKRVGEVRWGDQRGRANREIVFSVRGRWDEGVGGRRVYQNRIDGRVYIGEGNRDKGLMWVKKS